MPKFADRTAPSVVERGETRVMFLEAPDEPPAIRAVWAALEARIGSLRGRRFLGAFHGGTYRACAEVRDGDDPVALGLQTGVVAGGRYLRMRLRGEPPEVYDRIPDAFAALEAAAERDEGRPGIELYRRHDEIDVLLPLASGAAWTPPPSAPSSRSSSGTRT